MSDVGLTPFVFGRPHPHTTATTTRSFVAIGIMPVAPIAIGLLPIGMYYVGYNYLDFLNGKPLYTP